jgi:hypothetical protein
MVLAMSVSAMAAAGASAQTPAAPATQPWDAPAVGAQAPDFELAGATRYGLLKTPIRLSDFRDKTVVIAFFAQARTKG